MNYYAGIGNRKVPSDVILSRCTSIATELSQHGYILRSGGAIGCDSAFELGSKGLKEIFVAEHATMQSILMASKYHPNWKACNDYARKLHGRNLLILLGNSLGKLADDAVSFVVCYASDEAQGGTALALNVAKDYGIPYINLRDYTEFSVNDIMKKISTF